MMDTLTTCREALQDSQHKLHQATWLLFGNQLNLKTVDRLLGNQKTEVIPLCLAILDIEELYWEASLGSGNAPINAVTLLGHWQVIEAIPQLLRIVDEDDDDAIVNDRALMALGEMGMTVVDILLERIAREKDNWRKITYASILCQAGRGDPRVYEVIRDLFDKQTKPLDIEFMAENLLMCDLEQGRAYLQSRLQERRYRGEIRATLERIIEGAETWHDI